MSQAKLILWYTVTLESNTRPETDNPGQRALSRRRLDCYLAAYLDSGFGMVRGREPFQVEIAFDEYQARWIRERKPFHPTEEREDLADGGLLLRMRVTALDSVKRFVMQYGARAMVVRPEE